MKIISLLLVFLCLNVIAIDVLFSTKKDRLTVSANIKEEAVDMYFKYRFYQIDAEDNQRKQNVTSCCSCIHT
ncbi:hypothetical protein DHD80_00515 [Gramella sp. AN32]|nr:hypothetical protein [Gramella sp. AN32]